MDKDIGLLDEFFKCVKKFFLYTLAIGLCVGFIGVMIMGYKQSKRPIIITENTTEQECECIRGIVDEMRRDGMTTLTIKRIDEHTYNFYHAYNNGKDVSYTHQWK